MYVLLLLVDVGRVWELCRAVAPSRAIKVDAGVKAKARQEAQKAKAQARKGNIPMGMVQQSYSRGASVSSSASSASAATVSSTETQYGLQIEGKNVKSHANIVLCFLPASGSKCSSHFIS
jgi:hypothetical protein